MQLLLLLLLLGQGDMEDLGHGERDRMEVRKCMRIDVIVIGAKSKC